MTATPHEMGHLAGTGRAPDDAPPLESRVIRGPWPGPKTDAGGPAVPVVTEPAAKDADLVPHISDAEIVDDAPTGRALAPTRVHRRVVVPAGVTRAGQALRRPDRIVGAVLRHELVYGSIGTARGAGALWRWMTAAELDQHLATSPQLVLDTRRKRRNLALGGAGTVAAGTSALWLMVSPWAVLGMVALILAVAGAVERKSVARGHAESGHAALGPAPSGKEIKRAMVSAKIAKSPQGIRTIGPVTRTGDAWESTLDLPPGTTFKAAMKRRGELAAAIGVDEVQVAIDPVKGHAGRVRLWVADEDPMQGPRVENPLVSQEGPVNFWKDRMFAGADTRGRPVAFSMVERSYLIGGEPGGGKSVASNNVLAWFFLDPRIKVYLADGKFGTDLMMWEPMAHAVLADQDQSAMLDFVSEVRDEMNRRYALKRELRIQTFTEADAEKHGLHPIVLHIDELQYWTASGDTKVDKACMTAIADIVARGRAVGIIVGVVTQRPAAEVVPTRLRDILSIRWALRCTTPTASDTILGQGWAARGYSAGLIQPDQRGAGYVLAEGSSPVQMRAAFIDPGKGEIEAIASRAARLRREAGTLGAPDDDPRVLLLRAMHTAMRDERGDHTEHLLSSLREADPGRWGDLTSDALAATLRPLEVTPGQVKITDPQTGKKINRNGYRRQHLARALEALRAL